MIFSVILTINYWGEELGMEFINCDYHELLENMSDKSVDLLVTDPPYLHVKGGCKTKWLNKEGSVKDPNGSIVKDMSDFGEKEINHFLDAVKPKMKSFNAFIFCSKLQLPYYLNYAVNNKIQFDVLIWDKCSNGLHSYKFFSTKYEYIVRLYKNGLYKCDGETHLYQKVLRHKSPENKIHVAQKPLELVKGLIKVGSQEGDIILDTFAGSCTTGIACEQINRKCICCEKDLDTYVKAVDRINNLL